MYSLGDENNILTYFLLQNKNLCVEGMTPLGPQVVLSLCIRLQASI